jgi:hypothetical protein
MSNAGQTVAQATDGARRAAASPWVAEMARLGYATRGFLYVVVGLLALELAAGQGGSATGTRGAITAMTTIRQRPLAVTLLVLVIFGLLAYSFWGLVRATVRPAPHQSSLGDVTLRFSYLVSCLWYGSLVPVAVDLLLGRGGGQESAELASVPWTSRLLGSAAGQPILLLAGLLCLAFAAWQGYESITAGFRRDFDAGGMPPDLSRWTTAVGRAGYAARGVAYGLIGWLVVQAARHRNPGEVKGMEGALQAVQAQPHGTLLLATMAIGLIAFGLYSLVFSRWAHARGL